MATTLTRVDEDIKKCILLLSDLRSQKNSSLPIFRLPPETLANVFLYIARMYHEGKMKNKLHVPYWVKVSYVCRHWRNVALNCSTLWTYHFIVSPRWTEELLARSKRAPLKIRFKYTYDTSDRLSRLVDKLLDHAERIQELRLDILADVPLIERFLNSPRLQTLDIRGQTSVSASAIKHLDIPSLRTLKLTGCSLPWHSTSNLNGVTTLFLCCGPYRFQQNLMELLATLSRMQALARLHLDHVLPCARDVLSSGEFRAFPKVHLPCLTRLSVHALVSTAIVLLSCIDIPLKAHIKLGIHSGD